MRFLVDENLGKRFENLLKEAGHDAVFVGDVMRGAKDENILAVADNEKRILLTDDKGFGELVFRFKIPTAGVILFRTKTQKPDKRLEILSKILNKSFEGRFIVLREAGARIRKLM